MRFLHETSGNPKQAAGLGRVLTSGRASVAKRPDSSDRFALGGLFYQMKGGRCHLIIRNGLGLSRHVYGDVLGAAQPGFMSAPLSPF